MKKSELATEIKNQIYELLSEVDADPKGGSVVMKKGTNPADIKKLTTQGIDVELREEDSMGKYKVGDILNLKDGEDWKVMKVKDKVGKLVIKPHNEKAKKGNVSLEIDVDLDYLKKNLKEEEEEKEDNWNKEDKEDKRSDDKEPSKAELAKEKVKGAPSKFKVPNDQFNDFKERLKTLVKKIKDMEKGAERDKKMAALKQFIKKPELVKAFKERDVKIDTGGLVG